MLGTNSVKTLSALLAGLVLSACGGGGGGDDGDTGTTNQPPSASFATAPTSGIAPLAVAFDASASSDSDGSITAYAWSFGDGQSASGATTSHTYTSAGSYTVTLTVTDNDGASDSGTANITVTADQPPTASFTMTPTSGIAPLTVAFDASASSDSNGSITTYAWSFGDGQSGNGATTSHTYTSAGSYSVTLTVTDNDGVTDTESADLIVTPAPTYSLSGTISSADNIAVDSDLNNPLAPYAANSTANEAQSLPNPVMLNGFVSSDGTGNSGDRFANSGDTRDIYRTSLYAGQYVSLRVTDFDENNIYDYDVDIGLYDVDTLDPIVVSQSYTEFESVSVPQDGDYYILVEAYKGINKYVLSIGSTSLANATSAGGWPADFVPNQAIVKQRPQTLGMKPTTALGSPGNVRLSHRQSNRLALLSLSPATSPAEVTMAMRGVSGPPQRTYWSERLSEEVKQKLDTLEMIKQLNRQPDMEAASPNFIVKALLEPDDSYYSYQEHYRQIHLPQAWEITTGTPASGDVIVAVVDTGVALDHEDLTGQLIGGYDFISDAAESNDGDGIDNDPNDPGTSRVPGESGFHGTHVAGTIAAASNNNQGVAGIAWGAKIMPLRVLGLGGSGSLYDILQAVRYAAGLSNDSNTLPPQRADVINLSLGAPGYVQQAQNTFNEVRSAGVIVVAAAGNSNSSEPFYPAAYDGVVSVSAMDWLNAKAPYSNFGATIDVAAPGGDASVDRNGDGFGDGILSTIINDSSGERVSNYAFYQGTSMASPHVAGVAALMKAVNPSLTPDDFDLLLVNGELTNDLGDAGRDDIYGYGMIDALKAVQAAQNGSGTPPPATVIVSPTQIDFGISQTTARVSLTGYGDTPPDITAVNSSAGWLSVTPESVDSGGRGDYTLTVDRSALVDAVYSGTASFGLSDGNTLEVSVTMRVLSAAPTVGNAGFLYLQLLDPDLNSQAQLTLSPQNGRYEFQFQNIPSGDYYLVAGSDVDNDGQICDVGESCGAYPLRNQEALVTVDQNLSGIDFSATINSGLSGATSLSIQLPDKALELPAKPIGD